MRYDYLKAYLDTVVPPLRCDLIIQACELLHELGIDGHEYELQQELALAENADTSIVLSSIDNLLLPVLRISLQNFGITLNDDATMQQIVDVLNGVNGIENYGDPESILIFCDNAEGPEEALAQILPLLGQYTMGEYLALLDTVEASLLEQIERVLPETITDHVPSSDAVLRARERLNLYRVNRDHLLVIEDIRNGQRLGLPIALYMEYHTDAFDGMDIPTLTEQLLGFVLASDTQNDHLRATCMVEIEAVLHDPVKVTLADIQLTKLLKGIVS